MKDNFTCECGNMSHADGFYPCDKEGNLVEPVPAWEGRYKCNRCNEIHQ